MHVHRSVARTRKAVAEPEEGPLCCADQARELLDRFRGTAGDLLRPLRRARAHVLGKFLRHIGVAIEIIPIRLAVAEQAMHHRQRERAVGAGLDQHREIRLLHRAVHVDIDRDDLRAALFARAHRMRHHVDLRVDRIGAPDHDQIGFRHFARIGPGDLAGSGGKTGVGRVDADRGMKAGIFLHVAQTMDAVAHHQTHGAGVIIRPDRLRAMRPLGLEEFLRHEIERVIPRHRRELPGAFRARSARSGCVTRSG